MEKNHLQLQPNNISSDTKVSMRTRVLSAIIGLIIVVPLLVLGDWFTFALITFMLVVAILEIVRCAKQKYSIWLYIVTFFLAACIAYWPIIVSLCNVQNGWRIFTDFSSIKLPITILASGVFLLFVIVISDEHFTVRDACFIFTLVVLITLGLQSALYLRYLPVYLYHNELIDSGESVAYFNLFDNMQSVTLFFYVVIATFFTDIGAYFIGIFFGHKKINPRISPKKTWGGFFGGIFISAIFSLGYAFIMCACGVPVLKGALDLKHWYHLVILSLCLPIIATLGDFVFSSVKRYYGIKDYGKLIPGHGGVLDRLDSLLFCFIFSAVYLNIVTSFTGGVINIIP